jgi:membrane-associated phospholipid phosphatase
MTNNALNAIWYYIRNRFYQQDESQKGFFKMIVLWFYSVAPLLRVSKVFFSIFGVLFLLLASFLPVSAEALPEITAERTLSVSQSAQPDRISGDYILGGFADTGKMLASPIRWDGNDWLTFGAVLGTTTGLIFADADIRDFTQRNQSSTGNGIAKVGNALGNPLYTLPPLGLFYLYGHYSDDPKARRASLLAVESLAISGVFTWTIKLAAQRPRPFTGESPTSWNGPSLKSTNPAFPSGHTQSAFSIASVLAEEYATTPAVAPIAYGLAALTGLSRMYDNKHWASDVFFGAAVGYFVGKAVVRYHTAPGNSAVTLLPTVNQQGFGLMAEYRF